MTLTPREHNFNVFSSHHFKTIFYIFDSYNIFIVWLYTFRIEETDTFSRWDKEEENNSNCEYINVDKSKLPLTINEDGIKVKINISLW